MTFATTEPEPKRKLSRFARIALCSLGILVGLFVLELKDTEQNAPQNAPSTPVAEQQQAQEPPSNTAAQTARTPHQQRLADLRNNGDSGEGDRDSGLIVISIPG